MKKLLLFQYLYLRPSYDSRNPRLRISDILVDDDDGDCLPELPIDGSGKPLRNRDGCSILRLSSPLRIVSRWLVALRRAKEQRPVLSREETEKEATEFRNENLPARPPVNGSNNSDPSSDHCKKDASFQLGIWCGLLYLIAASKNELTKIMELRGEMEMVLQDAKEELRRKDILAKPFKVNNNLSNFASCVCESSISNSHVSVQSHTPYVPLESKSNMLPSQSLECNTNRGENCAERMDELEAELEAELKLLQLHLDRESSFGHQQLQEAELAVKDISSSSPGEVNYLCKVVSEECCGIPPIELERRLHELIEARQGERIQGLESALQGLQQKLLEKETEISRWNDSAKLISSMYPET